MKNVLFSLVLLMLLGYAHIQRPIYAQIKKSNKADQIDTIAIKSIISKFEHRPCHNIKVMSSYVDCISLFWNDPGYVEGPTICINGKCWIIEYSTDTYEDNGTLRYTDDYKFYVMKDDNLIIRKNRYYGPDYPKWHGGSCILLLENEDDMRYRKIPKQFLRTKNFDKAIKEIEIFLKK